MGTENAEPTGTFIDADESTEEIVGGILESMNEPSEMAESIIQNEMVGMESAPVNPNADWDAPTPKPQKADAVLFPSPSPVTPLTEKYQDAAGTVFNPDIHAVDENSLPKKKADGTWAKKRGRKAGTVSASAAPVPGAGAGTGTTANDANELAALNAAVVTVQMIFLCGKAIGAEEWEPLPHEPGMLQDAWKNYYLTSGVTQVPPWLGVAIATGAYALPRTQKPKTKLRLWGIYFWTKQAVYSVASLFL